MRGNNTTGKSATNKSDEENGVISDRHETIKSATNKSDEENGVISDRHETIDDVLKYIKFLKKSGVILPGDQVKIKRAYEHDYNKDDSNKDDSCFKLRGDYAPQDHVAYGSKLGIEINGMFCRTADLVRPIKMADDETRGSKEFKKTHFKHSYSFKLPESGDEFNVYQHGMFKGKGGTAAVRECTKYNINLYTSKATKCYDKLLLRVFWNSKSSGSFQPDILADFNPSEDYHLDDVPPRKLHKDDPKPKKYRRKTREIIENKGDNFQSFIDSKNKTDGFSESEMLQMYEALLIECSNYKDNAGQPQYGLDIKTANCVIKNNDITQIKFVDRGSCTPAADSSYKLLSDVNKRNYTTILYLPNIKNINIKNINGKRFEIKYYDEFKIKYYDRHCVSKIAADAFYEKEGKEAEDPFLLWLIGNGTEKYQEYPGYTGAYLDYAEVYHDHAEYNSFGTAAEQLALIAEIKSLKVKGTSFCNDDFFNQYGLRKSFQDVKFVTTKKNIEQLIEKLKADKYDNSDALNYVYDGLKKDLINSAASASEPGEVKNIFLKLVRLASSLRGKRFSFRRNLPFTCNNMFTCSRINGDYHQSYTDNKRLILLIKESLGIRNSAYNAVLLDKNPREICGYNVPTYKNMINSRKLADGSGSSICSAVSPAPSSVSASESDNVNKGASFFGSKSSSQGVTPTSSAPVYFS